MSDAQPIYIVIRNEEVGHMTDGFSDRDVIVLVTLDKDAAIARARTEHERSLNANIVVEACTPPAEASDLSTVFAVWADWRMDR